MSEERFDRLEAMMAKMMQAIVETKAELKSDIARVEGNMASLEMDLKGQIAALHDGQKALQEGQDALRADVSELKKRLFFCQAEEGLSSFLLKSSSGVVNAILS